MDDGEEAIDDAEALAQVRRQARKVLAQAATSALVLLAVALALPEAG